MKRAPFGTRGDRLAGGGIVLGGLLLQGCLMGGACGGGMHSSAAIDPPAAAPGVARAQGVERDDWSATLEVPPLVAGAEATLRLRLLSTSRGEPIRDARVTFEIGALPASGETGPGSAAPIQVSASEQASPGEYAAQHRFEAAGVAEITASIQSAEEARPLVVRVRQEVGAAAPQAAPHAESARPHDRSALDVAGAVAMALMMVLMMGAALH